MGRNCYVCGKGTTSGFNVSHSNVKTKRKVKANLQRIRIMAEGRPVRKYVCTTCIKSDRIERAL
ncbi:MAG TPA: 50S ribosomal protein L28 [Firmicutes bacterium]|nr:50S ribosomal protein L28 [Bacillota bacterium]